MMYVFLVLLMFTGSIMQMITGLGLPIIAMIILPHVISYEGSLGVVALINLGHAFVSLLSGERRIDYRKCFSVIAVYFVVSTIAVRFLLSFPREIMMRMMGAVLVVIGLYFIFFNRNMTLKTSMAGNVITGTACGIMGAWFGFFGPPLSIYYLATSEDAVEYQSNIRFTYLITALYTLWLRIQSGFMTPEVIRYGIVSVLALTAGVRAGRKYLGNIRGEKLKLAVYWALVFCGAVYLIRGG